MSVTNKRVTPPYRKSKVKPSVRSFGVSCTCGWCLACKMRRIKEEREKDGSHFVSSVRTQPDA